MLPFLRENQANLGVVKGSVPLFREDLFAAPAW